MFKHFFRFILWVSALSTSRQACAEMISGIFASLLSGNDNVHKKKDSREKVKKEERMTGKAK